MRCLLFFLICLPAFRVQSQELFFTPPSGFHNLPSQETYRVLQDSKGLIWITTDAGLCRYDGNQLTVFTVKDGLPENVVFKAYEDDKGRIWFTTLSGYFFYYYKGTFHSIAANKRLKIISRYFSIGSFFIGKNDTLFLTTLAQPGLIKILPDDNYKEIMIDTSVSNLCGRFTLTNKLHPKEFVMGVGPFWDKDPLSYIFSYNKKKVEISLRKQDMYAGDHASGYCDDQGNLYAMDSKHLFVLTKEGIVKDNYYFDHAVYDCYIDRDNDLWVATAKGGYLFKNANLHSTPIQFLKKIGLASVFQDREGTIWVATLKKGVLQCFNKNLIFFKEEEDKPAYFQKTQHQLNISFASKKIFSLYENDSLFINEEIENKINSTFNLCSSYLDSEVSYFGLATKLFIWDHKNSAVPIEFWKRVNVSEILKTGKDSMLFVTPSTLVIFNNKKVEMLNTLYPNKFALLLKNRKILVSSRNNGIYELKNNQLVSYLSHLPQLKTRINCMIEDRYGNLWIATNDYGLYCYDSKQKLHQYTTANNLGSDKINTLTIDDRNNLWLGSFNGLTKLSYTEDLQKVTIINFNKSHGIPDIQIERLASFNGKIAGISRDICFYFGEDQLKINTTPPLNYINSVFINDESYDVTGTAVLNYAQNNFHILVSSLTYKNTEQKKFLYKLIGYDDEWHASTTGDIQYTNLSHGSYTFMVYGLNNDNLKSDRPATFRFKIQRPFWVTWWFIALEIILFCIVVYFVLRLWKGRIQKREHDKALINQKIAEFKMTALRSQMNPHFVFNAISSIQHYILKQDTFKSYNYLAKFSLLIRTILDNSKEEYIALSQEINTLKLYIELEQIRFKQPFKFILDVDEALEMETYIPTMLIQPYVENSIWHGLMPKQTNCILEVHLKRKKTHISVTIKDNGVGRKHIAKKSSLHGSKGMSITEQRIKELETTNEKKFDVTILDLTDEKGNPTGTEVQIIIPFDL